MILNIVSTFSLPADSCIGDYHIGYWTFVILRKMTAYLFHFARLRLSVKVF